MSKLQNAGFQVFVVRGRFPYDGKNARRCKDIEGQFSYYNSNYIKNNVDLDKISKKRQQKEIETKTKLLQQQYIEMNNQYINTNNGDMNSEYLGWIGLNDDNNIGSSNGNNNFNASNGVMSSLNPFKKKNDADNQLKKDIERAKKLSLKDTNNNGNNKSGFLKGLNNKIGNGLNIIKNKIIKKDKNDIKIDYPEVNNELKARNEIDIKSLQQDDYELAMAKALSKSMQEIEVKKKKEHKKVEQNKKFVNDLFDANEDDNNITNNNNNNHNNGFGGFDPLNGYNNYNNNSNNNHNIISNGHYSNGNHSNGNAYSNNTNYISNTNTNGSGNNYNNIMQMYSNNSNNSNGNSMNYNGNTNTNTNNNNYQSNNNDFFDNILDSHIPQQRHVYPNQTKNISNINYNNNSNPVNNNMNNYNNSIISNDLFCGISINNNTTATNKNAPMFGTNKNVTNNDMFADLLSGTFNSNNNTNINHNNNTTNINGNKMPSKHEYIPQDQLDDLIKFTNSV